MSMGKQKPLNGGGVEAKHYTTYFRDFAWKLTEKA